MTSKAGQVTIFIVVAIMLVVLVVLFFLFRSDLGIEIGPQKEFNSNAFLENCLEDSFQESLQQIMISGGYSNPSNYVQTHFENEPLRKTAYLCYQEASYIPCVNQEPRLYFHMEEELKESLEEEINYCFDDLTRSLENSGYNVEVKRGDFSFEILPEKINLIMKDEISLSKEDSSSFSEKGFSMFFSTKAYSLIYVAQQIINSEVSSENCNFDYINYQLLYNEFKIDKFVPGNGDEIYTVIRKDSGEKFRFAVKGCLIK